MGKPTGIDVSQYEDRAAYMRAYRAVRPERHEDDKRRVKAHRDAEQILRRRHPEEFEAIYRSLLNAERNDGPAPCKWCNDEGIVHTHDGEIIGPCECTHSDGQADG